MSGSLLCFVVPPILLQSFVSLWNSHRAGIFMSSSSEILINIVAPIVFAKYWSGSFIRCLALDFLVFILRWFTNLISSPVFESSSNVKNSRILARGGFVGEGIISGGRISPSNLIFVSDITTFVSFMNSINTVPA